MREYFRNGPPHRGGADVSFADIVKLFGFNSVRIGRWVTAQEQQAAANLFFDALCDLQMILGVNESVISLRGSLSINYGIGGRLGASAHYIPSRRLLALAKNAGGGSLAHEWFHAFDHYIASHLFSSSTRPGRFASKAWLLDEPVRSHHLNEPLVLGFQRLFLSRDGQTASPLMKRCIAFDKAQRSYYFSMPEEVAARCFERIVQQQSLKNHFLVAGTLKSKTAELGLYPKQDEANAVAECWLDYFQALGRALEQSH
ncbi:CLCA_X family protein [Idiomarina sp.]|uniref:CLCA_X family protein n=1 Tax=Idiomarina sp. TaxID=1874361 RepID=UPI0025C73312|nr:CLCA_X family protein [Idiomarina sp.]NQZ03982.1 hypothetical protein [Idiomarina sp.]